MKGGCLCLGTFEAEMVRQREFQKRNGSLSNRSLLQYNANKNNGKQKFLDDEAFNEREHFFPELSLEYLFGCEKQKEMDLNLTEGWEKRVSEAAYNLYLRVESKER